MGVAALSTPDPCHICEAVACSLLSYVGTHSADTYQVLRSEMLVLHVNSYNYLVITYSLRMISPKQQSNNNDADEMTLLFWRDHAQGKGICITQDMIGH